MNKTHSLFRMLAQRIRNWQ